jgi:NAD(P)H-dependent FMN reductase
MLCGSRKPAPGVDRPSSSRELLKAVAAGLDDEGAQHTLIDLRDLDLPHFDGRGPDDYDSPDLQGARKTIADTDVLIVSAPAYWSSVSGPLVNFLNLLGGANYDRDPDFPLPLDGLTAVLLTIGADDPSAYLGAQQLRGILTSMGAWVAPREVTIGNPRRIARFGDVVAELRRLGQYAATTRRP